MKSKLRVLCRKNRIFVGLFVTSFVVIGGCANRNDEDVIKPATKEVIEISTERTPRIMSKTLNASEKLEGDLKYYCAVSKHTKFDADGNAVETETYEYLYNGQLMKKTTQSMIDDSKNCEEYMYDINGNVTEHVKYVDEFHSDEYSYTEYNDHGDTTLKYEYKDGGGVEIVSEDYFEYEYDENDNLLSYKSSQKPTVTYYTYDEYGSKSEEFTYNADGGKVTIYTFENRYDKEGRLAEVTVRYPDGLVEQVYKYTYYKDAPGQKKSKLQHYKETSLFYTLTEYDINGNVTTCYSYSVNENDNIIKGSLEGYELKFDEEGRLTEETVYVPNIYDDVPDDPTRTIYRYIYEYDSDGNISKMTLLGEDGEPTSYETWEYEKIRMIIPPINDFRIGKK